MTALDDRLTELDGRIVELHCKYLKATWAYKPVEAELHRREVDRLLELRLRVQDGPLTATP